MSDWELVVLRLLIAAALGSLIGAERERLVWAAGLRNTCSYPNAFQVPMVKVEGAEPAATSPHSETKKIVPTSQQRRNAILKISAVGATGKAEWDDSTLVLLIAILVFAVPAANARGTSYYHSSHSSSYRSSHRHQP